jgi:required for meiotic nuclear division protein 1
VTTLPVNAYGFSATFKLKDLASLFDPKGELRVKERLIAPLGPERWVLAYDFGAVVFVGVGAAEQARLIAEVNRRLPAEPHPPLTENFLIEVQPEVAQSEVRFDRVVVNELNTSVVDIVAWVLAQSVAMDFYAQDVDEIEAETDRIATHLRTRGQVPGGVRKMIQFIGLCIATRNDVISTLALFDKPDATWESEPLDRLWEGLYRMLELDDRYKVLEAKLRMFQDNLTVLVDLTRARQNILLEATIVILIVMEMAVMVWQLVSATGH